MNQTNIAEIIQRRTVQLTVLSVVFVGLMVILVPSLVEEAQARIDATVISSVGTFSDVKGKMSDGKFVTGPDVTGPVITWTTTGFGALGDEKGAVEAYIAGVIPGGKAGVAFLFSNPGSGPNTCQTFTNTNLITSHCLIEQGFNAKATFYVVPNTQQGNSNFCDILHKFGGIEQTKIIREKLHC